MNSSARRLTPWYLLTVLVFGIVAAAAVGVAEHNAPARQHAAPAAPAFYPPTGFGGYNWVGVRVNQISARWVVPTTSTKPFQRAGASTWIGLQQLGSQAFIQVGTVESVYGPSNSTDVIFWSDTQKGFHPQVLTEVHSGDHVAASMVRRAGGWELRVRDLTTNTAYPVMVRDDARTDFDVAEYTEEDPAPGSPSTSDIPYPTTSTVKFDHLLVNERAPTLVLGEGAVLMSPNGIDLVPTPEIDDSFSLVPPQGEAARYLRGASRLDFEDVQFAYDESRWQSLTPAQRHAAVNVYVAALAESVKLVDSLSAPPSSVKTDYAKQMGALERDFRAWSAQGLPSSGPAFQNLMVVSHRPSSEEDVNEIRTSLGLPPA